MRAARVLGSVVALVSLVATAALAGPAGPASCAPAPDCDEPTLGALISGTSQYVDGVFVWTDYAYDDRGPNTNPVLKGGDAAYPDEAEPGNAADLIQLQLDLAPGGALRITAVLQTLVDPALPLLGVGFDIDRDAGTGARDVPGGTWRAAAPLGLDVFVTIGATGAELLVHDGQGWSSAGTFPATVDPERNVMQTVVPRALLDPGSGAWRAVGVLGLGIDGHSWLEGEGPIHDLAFVRAEDPYTETAYAVVDAAAQVSGQVGGDGSATREWQDHRQAAVLAGELDGSNALALVDLDRIRRQVTELAAATEPGFHTFLYRSHVRIGEGVTSSPRQYRGRYQPYLVRLPAGAVDEPAPLLVFLHGNDQNHLQTANYFAPSATDFISPGSFDPPGIVIFPLGRDPGWGTALSEQDFLDATADAAARLPIDLDRVVVSGISAGGMGTFRYGTFYPDRFSGLYSLVGMSTSDHLGNLRNVPTRMMNGALDPLINAGLALVTAQRLEAADGVDYRAWIPNIRSHVPVPALGDCVLAELLTTPRQTNPARVTYTADPGQWHIDPEVGLHLVHDGAWWVSGIVPREAAPATVDATSLARADREQDAASTHGVGENITAGRDFCGDNPAVRTGDTWEELGRALSPAAPAPVSNGLELAISDVEAVTIDLDRAGLDTRDELVIAVSGDGPAALTLLGAWTGPVTVLRDGEPFAELWPSAGAIQLTDSFAGERRYTLIP